MKECPNCGEYMFTGLRSGKGFHPFAFVFPQYRACRECGETVRGAGWFERNL